MSFTIKAGGVLSSYKLKVTNHGVMYTDAMWTHKFDYDEIYCLLLSPDSVLSFQVNDRVFSVQTDPNNRAHNDAIEDFKARLLQSNIF